MSDHRKTPPSGVASIQDEGWDEEDTNVGDPLQQLNARTKNTAAASRATYGAVGALRKELRAESKLHRDAVQQVHGDFAVHLSDDKASFTTLGSSVSDVKSKVDQLEGQVGKVDGKVDKVDGKVDKLAEHVGDLREIAARTGAHVERLVSIDNVKEAAKIKANSRIETAREEASIEDAAHAKKLRRQLFMKFAVPIVAAIGTVLATLVISRC